MSSHCLTCKKKKKTESKNLKVVTASVQCLTVQNQDLSKSRKLGGYYEA